jgi:hypothetical protein
MEDAMTQLEYEIMEARARKEWDKVAEKEEKLWRIMDGVEDEE